ncbi:hypothetical protein UFOVP1326_13 [uncultured Caudovirales phage]|uniref:Uncharacterized protein n=1 Tax=uncultured Caudovirales phage TaxID=2100421 RepID=A0A6J5SFI5_9CAUD|nr:hypothetical protein UFOVP1326_13 [uncultured Caudovirales phage]CAB4212664.1 hypothetical protein UFOVP1436_26 [uncultured Caudovirales phage]
MKALRRWLLAMKIDNAKREIEMFELDLATAAQNRDIMRRNLARLEIAMIDLEHDRA